MRSRAFRILAWSSLLCCTALLVLGVISYWIRIPLFNLQIGGGHQTLQVARGWFSYAASNKFRGEDEAFLGDGFTISPLLSIFRGVKANDPSHTVFAIGTMVWPCAFITGIPLAVWVLGNYLHRRKARMRMDKQLCVSCGYDLRASKDRCPECGMLIQSAAPGDP